MIYKWLFGGLGLLKAITLGILYKFTNDPLYFALAYMFVLGAFIQFGLTYMIEKEKEEDEKKRNEIRE